MKGLTRSATTETAVAAIITQPRRSKKKAGGPPGHGPALSTATLDWRPEFDKAVAAFTKNAFLILVDERQATSLDEEVELGSTTRISFVRLTLLVGG